MSLRAWDSAERGKAVEERMFPRRRTPASCCPPSAGVKRPDESGKWQGGQAKEAFGALFCLLRVKGREGRLRKLFGQLSASSLLLPSPPARLASRRWLRITALLSDMLSAGLLRGDSTP